MIMIEKHTNVPMTHAKLAEWFEKNTREVDDEVDFPKCCDEVMVLLPSEPMKCLFQCMKCEKMSELPSCRSSHRYCAWEIANPIEVDDKEIF